MVVRPSSPLQTDSAVYLGNAVRRNHENGITEYRIGKVSNYCTTPKEANRVSTCRAYVAGAVPSATFKSLLDLWSSVGHGERTGTPTSNILGRSSSLDSGPGVWCRLSPLCSAFGLSRQSTNRNTRKVPSRELSYAASIMAIAQVGNMALSMVSEGRAFVACFFLPPPLPSSAYGAGVLSFVSSAPTNIIKVKTPRRSTVPYIISLCCAMLLQSSSLIYNGSRRVLSSCINSRSYVPRLTHVPFHAHTLQLRLT
ncbi:hypothetical protein F5Y04DRAFT_8450 [Hypomontagnella monticulosa]|nr:hypothetical protein F5Y04DRAFT_8450 [Hypomontagnella monticulosa]